MPTKNQASGNPGPKPGQSDSILLQKRPNVNGSRFAIFGMEEDCVEKEKVVDEQMEHVEEVGLINSTNLMKKGENTMLVNEERNQETSNLNIGSQQVFT